MNSVINPSNDQQLLLDNMRIPKGWHSGNPLITDDVWYNRYTSPAWINAQKGKGLLDAGPLRYSNQFTSAVVQPLNSGNFGPQTGAGRKPFQKPRPQ